MIGLDTHIIVRYIMQDDATQATPAGALIDTLTNDAPGFVSTVTLVEVTWVLNRSYGLSRGDIAEVIDGLLLSRQLAFQDKAEALQALTKYRSSKADYADCLIERLGHTAGCTATYTFDKAAGQHAGMTLLAKGV